MATGHGDVQEALRGIRTSMRDVVREQDSAGTSATRAGRAQTSAAERTEQALEKQLKEAQKLGKAIEAGYRNEERAAERAATTRIKQAERAAKAETAAHTRSVKEVLKARESFRKQAVGFTTGLTGSIATGMIGIGTAAVGASLATVGAAARDDVRLHDTARRLSVNSRMGGEGFADPTALTKEWHATAQLVRGIKAEDIAEGQGAFVAKTGDLASARKFSDTFATTASASGGSYSDIASSAADLMQKFDIKTIEDMQQALASLSMQGKKGAFELRDSAQYMSEMSAAAQRFGVGSGPQAIKTLGGLAQIARSATGSGAEASTAVQDLFGELVKHAQGGKHSLGASGVDVFDAKGNARDIKELLPEVIAKVGGGDIGAKKAGLEEIFGQRGTRAISPLISSYVSASQGAGGSEAQQMAAGMKAVREALDDAIEAPGNWADVVTDSAEAQKSAGAQLDAVWEDLKSSVSAQVIPALLDLGPKLGGIGDAALPLVDIFVSLVGVIGEFVAFLKEKGIIKDRAPGSGELQKKLDLFDQAEAARKKGRSELWNPDEATNKLDAQKMHERDMLNLQLNQTKAAEHLSKDTMQTRMGKEEFSQEYAKRIGTFGRFYMGASSAFQGDVKGDLEKQGGDIYDKLRNDPSGIKNDANSLLWRPMTTLGSGDAVDLTKRAAEFEEQDKNNQGAGQSGTDAQKAAEAMADLAAAVKIATAALGGISNTSSTRPSPFGKLPY